METKRIRALGTFRNDQRLPSGIVRRGQTVEVETSYAEELIESGKAEAVEEESGDFEADVDWENEPLPEDTPRRSLLKDHDIDTLGDLAHFVEEDLLQNINGIGPARQNQLEEFLGETVAEAT